MARTSTPWGVPNSCSKCSGSPISGRCGHTLRQEREDAAAVVVDDHDGHRQVCRRARDQRIEVVHERRRRPRPAAPARRSAAAAPSADETTPSMPLTPRLARHRTGASLPPGTRPGRGRASSCRRTTSAPSGSDLRSCANIAPSNGSSRAGDDLGGWRCRPRARHPARTLPRLAPPRCRRRARARASASATGSAWIMVAGASVGSFQPPVVDDDLLGAAASRKASVAADVGVAPNRITRSGSCRSANGLGPQQGIGAADHPGPVVWTQIADWPGRPRRWVRRPPRRGA